MTDLTEILDKNIERFVDAVKEAGPAAEHGLNETLSFIAIDAWASIAMALVALVVGCVFLWRGLKSAKDNEYKDGPHWIPVVIGSLISLVGFMIIMTAGPGLLSKALHPLGYFIYNVLR